MLGIRRLLIVLACVAHASVGGTDARAQVRSERTIPVIGSTALLGHGPHGRIWLYRGYAYVATSRPLATDASSCIPGGVGVVDLIDPVSPRGVGWLSVGDHTSVVDAHVAAVDTPSFRGDLLSAAMVACNESGVNGIGLWDVTDPRSPREVGIWVSRDSAGSPSRVRVVRHDGLTHIVAVFLESTGHARIVLLDVSRPSSARAAWAWDAPRPAQPTEPAQPDARHGGWPDIALTPDARIIYLARATGGWLGATLNPIGGPTLLSTLAPTLQVVGPERGIALALGGRVLAELAAVAVDAKELAAATADGLASPIALTIRTLGDDAESAWEGAPAVLKVCGGRPPPAAPLSSIVVVDGRGCRSSQRVAAPGAALAVIAAPADSSVTISVDEVPAVVVANGASADLVSLLATTGQVLKVTATRQASRDALRSVVSVHDVQDRASGSLLGTVEVCDDPAGRPRAAALDVTAFGSRVYVACGAAGIDIVDVSNPVKPTFDSRLRPRTADGRLAEVLALYIRGDIAVLVDTERQLHVIDLPAPGAQNVDGRN
jgi:hypothetical protein